MIDTRYCNFIKMQERLDRGTSPRISDCDTIRSPRQGICVATEKVESCYATSDRET